MRYRLIVVAAAVLLAACTGRDFAKPEPDALVLGETTQGEIVSKYGEPFRQSTTMVSGLGDATSAVQPTPGPFDRTVVAGTFTNLTYYYADRSKQVLIGGPATERAIGFDFWNGKLYGYLFFSNFTDDSSNFDESKTAQFERDRTTAADVVALLGPPSGKAGYPAVLTPGQAKFIYLYVATEDGKRISKRLEVLFGENGTVRDFRFASQSAPAPRPTGGGAVPIYIPAPRGR